MKIIIELVFILILGASIYTGWKKGLVAGIATLLSIIISMCVANALANTFSDQTTKMIHPFVDGYMDGTTGVIGKSLSELAEGTDMSVEDAVKQSPELEEKLCISSYEKMGMSTGSATKLAKKAVAAHEGEMGLSQAIIQVMSQALAYALAFMIFFALTIIILTIIINLFNLSLKFKKQGKLNTIGGIATGAVSGVFFCALAAWILKFLGVIISQETLSGVAIAWLFSKLDILSWFLPC